MTGTLSPSLRRLDDFLCRLDLDDEAMLLSELDGFLAGIIVCPELIPPSEWLPSIWGESEPVFDDERQANDVLGLIMGYYNDVIRQLNRGDYRPIYSIDNDDSALWEIWIEGFCQAMVIRPDAWRTFDESEDEGVRRAMFVFGRLGDLAMLSSDELDSIEIDQLLEERAPDLIPAHVEILHRARIAAEPHAPGRAAAKAKTGRNDPCPCGSGKKFKRCCLN